MRWPLAMLFATGVAACIYEPLEVNVSVPERSAPASVMPDLSAVTVAVLPGVTVHPTSGLTTTASGGKATFTVVLDALPTATVTIDLTSSDLTQGTVSPASLSFTAADWDQPQVVTVTGADDGIVSGDHVYTVITQPARSADPDYSKLDPPDVTVTNLETDVAGFVITPTSGLTTTAHSATATFTVRLTSEPSASVTLGLSSSDVTRGTVSPASLTFTGANWPSPQPVVITGVDDLIADGDQPFTIVTAPAVSTDVNYGGVNPPDVSVTNLETDVAGIIVTPTSGLVTTETGGTASFTVKLSSKPTATVSIGISSSNTNHGTVSTPSLSFTTATWLTPQTVTVTGVDDHAVTGNVVYTIVTAAAVSTDPVYSGMNAADVSVTSIDSSVAGITLSRTSGLQTVENGLTDSFTIQLNTQPSANVTIGFTSSNTSVATVSPPSVTFTGTAGSWNSPHTITVTGSGNANGNTAACGNTAFSIITAAATSTDTNYNGLNPSDVSGVSLDDDVLVYGGNSTDANSMVWCNTPTSCSTALSVSVPYRGGTVNFVLQLAAAFHGVESTAGVSEFANSPLLTTGPPWPLDAGGRVTPVRLLGSRLVDVGDHHRPVAQLPFQLSRFSISRTRSMLVWTPSLWPRIRAVRLDGATADPEPAGDLLAAESLGHQLGDFPLAPRQSIERVRRQILRQALALGQLLQRDARADESLTAQHAVDRLHQLARRRLLEHAPSAPTWSARQTYDSSPYIDSTTSFTSGASRLMSGIASRPLASPIRTSMTTRSGSCFRSAAMASFTLVTRSTTSRSGSFRNRAESASRTDW